MLGKHKVHTLPLIISFLIYLLLYPYFVWEHMDLMVYVSLFLAILLAINLDVKRKGRMLIFFILFVAYMFLSLNRGARIGGTILNLSLAFLPFIKYDLFKETYKIFRVLLIITFAVSIISYFTVAFGLQNPIGTIEPLNSMKQFHYVVYRFLVVPTNIDDLGRFCSIYDEPGVVGTIAGLLLIVEDFKLFKKGNIVVLLAGLLSFSLFFYLIIVIYLLYKLPMKYKVAAVLFVGVLFVLTSDNEIMNKYIWDRLEIQDSGRISGNNRNTDELIKLWDNTKWTPQIFLGYGFSYMEDYQASASIQLFILRDGIIFVLLFFLAYIIYAKNEIRNKKHVLLFVIILFATLYQRPGFCNMEFILLFTAYILRYYERNVGISCSSKL